jgi:hypothetical protein
MQYKKGTDEACVLQKAELIVWDECKMFHKHALKALDRTLKDIRVNQSDFVGVTCFCPVTSVRHCGSDIPRGTPADELAACFKSSYL